MPRLKMVQLYFDGWHIYNVYCQMHVKQAVKENHKPGKVGKQHHKVHMEATVFFQNLLSM